MWLGPVLFVGVSVFLWKYGGWVFMPLLVTRSILRWMPLLGDLETVILINASLLYFGMYFVFAIFWERIQPHLKNPLGPVAQLGARMTGSHEVRGSNPLRST